MTPGRATVEKVEENPQWYAGKTVTLIGEVDDVHSARAFELEGNDGIFDSEVLVVTKSDVSLAGRELLDDDDVAVTGKVQRFAIAEVEREVGWDLPAEIGTEWSDKPVVFANSVSLVGEYARWKEGDDEGTLIGVTAVHYHPDPVKLSGNSLQLSSVPIRELSKKGIWVGNNATSTIYVSLSDSQMAGLSQGDRVDIEGKIRETPKDEDIREAWELSDSMADSIESDGIYVEANSIKKRADSQQANAR